MVLHGFSSGSYIGWLAGILFIKSPQGTPVFPARKTLRTLYAAVVNIVILAVWIEFHFRHIQLIRNESMVDKFLSCSLLFGESAFDIYFRLCFFSRGKLIVKFLKTLETDYSKIPPIQIPPDDRKRWKRYRSLITFINCYHYFGAMIAALWVSAIIPTDTKVFGFISGTIYPIVFLFLGAIPLISSTIVASAFIVSTTFHIMWIFDDFCLYFEDQILSHEKQVFNPMKRDLGEIYSIPSKTSVNDQILNKFEHLKQLCSQYDKINGLLILGLLVRAVFILISAANTILLFSGTGTAKRIQFFINVYLFITEMTQLVLLQLGYMIHSRFAERKEELHRKVILMSNHNVRDQLKEAVIIVADWNWSISGGPRFFDVDRPLLSGVLSSLMTYVTILFQLNVADETSLVANGALNSTVTV